MAQLVRGEQESVLAAPSSSSPPPPPEQDTSLDSYASMGTHTEDSDGSNSNVGHPKKPAWNKPLNGVVGVGPVMGDPVSWPALSEAIRPPSKSTADSPNPSSDESVCVSQVPVISNSTQNQKKHPNTNSNPNVATNHKSLARQRSSKRGGGPRAGPVQNGFIRAPPPPPPPLSYPPPSPPLFPLFDMPYGAMVPTVPDYFPYKANSWEGMPMGGFVPQPNSVSYQSSPRDSSRRGNFRGHHNSRNASRSSNVRDVRVPQQIAPPRGFVRPPPPPGSISFIRPHSGGPFGYPMGYDMPFPYMYIPTPPLESFNEVPFTAQAQPPPPLSPYVDDTACASLVSQIDYYFCDDNLCRDEFLRSKMDDEGWVPLSLIAGFPKVQQWTNDIELILNSLKASSVVEVQPYKVRKRDDWRKWVSTPIRFARGSGFQSTSRLTEETITSSLLKVTLDEAATSESSPMMSESDSSTTVFPSTSISEELTGGHSNVANGETTDTSISDELTGGHSNVANGETTD